jgi:hypothetical protein
MICPECGKDISNSDKFKSKIYGLTEYYCFTCYEEIKKKFWQKKANKKKLKEGRKF